MTEYKNLTENYPLYVRPLQINLFLIMLACIVYAYYSSGMQHALTMLVVFIVIFTFSYTMGKRRRKQIFYSYKLTVVNDTLTRHQSNLPDISLSLNEIAQVTQLNRGFLLVTGPVKDDKIIIWPYVENFENIKALLESYRPLTPYSYKSLFRLYPILFPFVMLAAFSLAYLSTNKIVVGVGALVAAVCIGWLFYKARTSKQVDAGDKKWAWVMLVFLFFMALAVCNKLIS